MGVERPAHGLSPRSLIHERPDRTVLLEHSVAKEDDFARAARDVFALLKAAQDRHPGLPRKLVLEIDGHEGERGGYDADFFEFQQEFVLGALGPFFTWVEMPLTGSLGNPDRQQDTPHDRLCINEQQEES